MRNYNRIAQEKPRLVEGSNPPAATGFSHAFYDTLHNEGANLLFADGHAKWAHRTDARYTRAEYFDPALPVEE